MKLNKTEIEGLFLLEYPIFEDIRGFFCKSFHSDEMTENALNTNWKEEYYTRSLKNVIRGMHFQLPPFDHEKIVHCITGSALDVILDLRKHSSTFGKAVSFNLKAKDGQAVYIPKGCAHGFLSLEDDTILSYKVGSVHNAQADSGILWDSFGFNWPIDRPILSQRDEQHSLFHNFKSPF